MPIPEVRGVRPLRRTREGTQLLQSRTVQCRSRLLTRGADVLNPLSRSAELPAHDDVPGPEGRGGEVSHGLRLPGGQNVLVPASERDFRDLQRGARPGDRHAVHALIQYHWD